MERTRKLSYDGSVSSIVYSPDSSQMAIGGEDKQVIVCSSSTGTTLHKIACSSSIRSIAYSPDGEHIAVGTSVKTMVSSTAFSLHTKDCFIVYTNSSASNVVANSYIIDAYGKEHLLDIQLGTILFSHFIPRNYSWHLVLALFKKISSGRNGLYFSNRGW